MGKILRILLPSTVLVSCILFFISCSNKQIISAKEEKVESDSVLTFVEQMPKFPEGDAKMLNFIFENIKIPPIEINELPPTYASVRFIVRKTGKIENIESTGRNKESDLASSLIEVVKLMPDWIPGNQNGQPVDVYFTLPLHIDYKK